MNNKYFPHQSELLYLHRKTTIFKFEVEVVIEINEEGMPFLTHNSVVHTDSRIR
jgi:hypothetical protein